MEEGSLEGPELFFGIAGAVGTDLEAVTSGLRAALADRDYQVKEIRLSALLDLVDWTTVKDAPEIDDETIDRHIATRMDAGNCLRESLGRGDAVALLGILDVNEQRDDPKVPVPRTAYVFRSLKHPQEVETLREVYGTQLLLDLCLLADRCAGRLSHCEDRARLGAQRCRR